MITPTMDVTAVVRAVRPRMVESVPSNYVTVEFSNHSDHALVVESFRLVWPSDERAVAGVGIAIRPSQSASYTVQVVTPDALSPGIARVDKVVTRRPSLWDWLMQIWSWVSPP
jgi:hypothetical protein